MKRVKGKMKRVKGKAERHCAYLEFGAWNLVLSISVLRPLPTDS